MAEIQWNSHEMFFEPSNIFPADYVGPCNLDPQSVKSLRESSKISKKTVIRVPTGSAVDADWVANGWVCMYKIVLCSGVQFLFSPLMIGVIKALKVMPCQIMSVVWMIVHAIDNICSKQGLEISVEDLKYLYAIRTAGKRRFTLKARNTNQALIRDMPKEDGFWKLQFLFIKADSSNAGIEFSYFSIKEKAVVWAHSDNDDERAIRERIDKFMAVVVAVAERFLLELVSSPVNAIT